MKYLLLLITGLFFALKGYSQNTELLIFGCGQDNRSHQVFLGCLNCSEYDQNSVWNKYGQYGSAYGNNSLWNTYGTYGSSYSDKSPFNSYANCLPAIVDRDGNFYGYLTASILMQYRR